MAVGMQDGLHPGVVDGPHQPPVAFLEKLAPDRHRDQCRGLRAPVVRTQKRVDTSAKARLEIAHDADVKIEDAFEQVVHRLGTDIEIHSPANRACT